MIMDELRTFASRPMTMASGIGPSIPSLSKSAKSSLRISWSGIRISPSDPCHYRGLAGTSWTKKKDETYLCNVGKKQFAVSARKRVPEEIRDYILKLSRSRRLTKNYILKSPLKKLKTR